MKILAYSIVALALLLAGCDTDTTEIRDSYAIVEVDYNNDGIVDQTGKVIFSGITGKVALQEVDYTDANTPDVEVLYFRSIFGHLKKEETREVISGNTVFNIEYVNDESGNAIESHWDWNGDGVTDQIQYRTFNDDGDITRDAWDFDADGDLEREHLITFASPGQFATRAFDNNGDGFFEYFEQVDYGADPRRETRFRFDTNGSGSFNREFFATWTDNADGTVTRLLERDNDMNGSIDRTDTRVMLTDDMREYLTKTLSVFRDLNNDGNVDRVELNTFNAAGQVLTEAYDSNADGNPEYAYEYDYNSLGNLTEMRYLNSQGNVSYIMRVEYPQWELGQVELPSLDNNS
jgi:hypothetical protein